MLGVNSRNATYQQQLDNDYDYFFTNIAAIKLKLQTIRHYV